MLVTCVPNFSLHKRMQNFQSLAMERNKKNCQLTFNFLTKSSIIIVFNIIILILFYYFIFIPFKKLVIY